MSIIARDSGGKNFPPTDAGLHKAILYAIYDIGTQKNIKYNSESRKVILVWEFPILRINIEKEGEETKNLPRVISNTYTLSLGEKANLRHILETWRGKTFTTDELDGFDLKNVLGKSCQIQVVHKTEGEKTYANIGGIVQAPADFKLEAENPLVLFSIDDDDKIPENTPKWIVKKIEESKEWRMKEAGVYEDTNQETTTEDESSSDLPF